ncbi:MAG: hypothetical protein ACSLFC_00030 [Desulfuromonadales bacterium]
MFLEIRRIAGLVASISIFVIGPFLVTSAMAEDPYLKKNNSWISLSGTVKSGSATAFNLDYGDGIVTVEMDDGTRDHDSYKPVPGDKVTVNGRIDDDLYEKTSIEASSVYVEKLGTLFFASSVDEEDFLTATTTPVMISATVVQGLVTDVDDHEFNLDTGFKTLTVEVSKMSYNPLDDEGFQKIEVGDLVRVTGRIDRSFFEGRQLIAEAVTKLID